MGTDRVVSDSNTLLKDYYSAQKKKLASNPINNLKDRSEKIQEEVAEHERLSQQNDFLALTSRRITSGFYNASELQSIFSSLEAGSYNTGSSANGILYASNAGAINAMQTKIAEQLAILKNVEDSDVTASDLNFKDVKVTGQKKGVSVLSLEKAETVKEENSRSGVFATDDEILEEIQKGYI